MAFVKARVFQDSGHFWWVKRGSRVEGCFLDWRDAVAYAHRKLSPSGL